MLATAIATAIGKLQRGTSHPTLQEFQAHVQQATNLRAQNDRLEHELLLARSHIDPSKAGEGSSAYRDVISKQQAQIQSLKRELGESQRRQQRAEEDAG